MKATLKRSILFLFLMLYTIGKSQNIPIEKDSIPQQKKIKFGCGFGLNFVGGTSLSLSPNLIYSVSDKISLGVGIQGSYTKLKGLQTTTTIGANCVTNYMPSKKIQLLAELVQLHVKTETEVNSVQQKESFWDTALFAGAGYMINKNITIGAKYNFLYNENESVYTSPILPFVTISF